MKTHLPHGLRAALMAAIASVSLTSYAAAADYTFNWSTVKLESKGSIKNETSGAVFCPTVPSSSYIQSVFPGYSPGNKTSYNASGSSIHYINVVRSDSLYDGQNVYFDMKNVRQNYTDSGISALAGSANKKGNIYVRVSKSDSPHSLYFVQGVESGCKLDGSVYMELDDSNATYTGAIRGTLSADITGASTFVIRGGTFNAVVNPGIAAASSVTTIGGGSYLQVEGGTFNKNIVAGSQPVAKTATINKGTHLLINGGIFNQNVNVYGGSTGLYGVVNDGVELTINGGSFGTNSNVYALGSNGKVNGAVSLSIGNNAKFLGGNVISAGTDGTAKYSGVTSSKVMLTDLTKDSSLAADNNTIKVMGGQQGSQLTISNVHATINAQLSQFSAMEVRYESDLTLTQATNEALGGVSSVQINNKSILTLQNDAGKTWDLSGVKLTTLDEGLGTLKKTGAGQLTIGDTSAFVGGAISVLGGELSLSGATAAKCLTVEEGATLSVKEGNLFTNAAGAGSSISINGGATLAANEGNWTLNKAATIDGVTITGTHAVGLGSEVDKTAVVSLSGNIDATKGNLILKNTAVAAGKTATLSGNITFEGKVQNNGTLAIADGSTINIDEQTLIRNAEFIENGKTSSNGFLTDTAFSLTTGSAYTVDTAKVILTLDGETSDKLTLTKDTAALNIRGFADIVKGTYFVNEGNVAYSDIQKVKDQELTAIAVGNNGAAGDHQLILDETLAAGVKVISASDNAKVSVNEGVVLNASQTAVKGEANEVHVVGEGSVLMDDTSKLSQLAGTATMKLKDTETTFNSEAKMTGALKVADGQTLTVEDGGSIASFSSVEMGGENAKLASDVASGKTESIQSISGSGTLAKSGEGTLTVTDAKDFSGDVEVSGGILQVEDADLMAKESKRKISVSKKGVVNLTKLNTVVSVKEINISDGGKLGVYKGDTAEAGEGDANVGALTLVSGDKIVIGEGGGTLEANLTTESGSILDFTAGATLSMGCDLTVNNGTIIVLSEADFATLQNGAEGASVTLFSGVDNRIDMDASGLSIRKADGTELAGKHVSFSTDASGNAAISIVPEPATATLSLLALAALAARRRRK